MKQKSNARQHNSYSGGFKMAEVPKKGGDKHQKIVEKGEKGETPFDYKAHFPGRDEIFSKLGIGEMG